jgi:hypothetical protein
MSVKERKGSLKSAHDRMAATPKPELREKRRGGGKIVGTTIRWDSESWQAIHDMAIKERVSINTLLLNAVNLYRHQQGLPPLKPAPTKKELAAELE